MKISKLLLSLLPLLFRASATAGANFLSDVVQPTAHDVATNGEERGFERRGRRNGDADDLQAVVNGQLLLYRLKIDPQIYDEEHAAEDSYAGMVDGLFCALDFEQQKKDPSLGKHELLNISTRLETYRLM